MSKWHPLKQGAKSSISRSGRRGLFDQQVLTMHGSEQQATRLTVRISALGMISEDL